MREEVNEEEGGRQLRSEAPKGGGRRQGLAGRSCRLGWGRGPDPCPDPGFHQHHPRRKIAGPSAPWPELRCLRLGQMLGDFALTLLDACVCRKVSEELAVVSDVGPVWVVTEARTGGSGRRLPA